MMEETIMPLNDDERRDVQKSVRRRRKRRSIKSALIIIVVVLALLAVIIISIKQIGSSNNMTKIAEQQISEMIEERRVDGDKLPSEVEYRNIVYDNISYTVKEATQESAEIQFEYPDCIEIGKGYIGAEDNPTEYYDYVINEIKTGNYARKTESIVIKYVITEDNSLEITNKEDLLGPLTGGTYQLIKQMMGDE